MPLDLFELALTDDPELPPADTPDHLLARWLRQRLGRPPTYLEILELRAGLRERARRRSRRAWWQRLAPARPPRRDDLVDGFLRSWEGLMLLRLLNGSMDALLAQLALPDPWEGLDGRHPRLALRDRRDALRDRVAQGCTIPQREQLRAVLSYAEWKLTGNPSVPRGCVPADAEFLSATHAAAINTMVGADVVVICALLRDIKYGDAKRRAILETLHRDGAEAMRLWPGIERRDPGAPFGIRPSAERLDENKDMLVPGPSATVMQR